MKRVLRITSLFCFSMMAVASMANGEFIVGNDQNPFLPPDSLVGNDTVKLLFPLPDERGVAGEDVSKGKLYLEDPANLATEVEYDAKSNSYIYKRKVGSLNYRRPSMVSFDDYQEMNRKQAVKNYWRERARLSGQGSGGIIPQLHVKSQAFDRIFGSNTIDIRPSGSAELIFGVKSNKRDDPALDVRRRRTTNFDFQEKIQMNVIAKIGDKIEFNTNYNTEATFDFENKLKLKYEGKEDEIIQLIEAGNVTLPLNSTLIQGSQSLFGVKTQLRFGRATVTALYSEQKSESQTITVQGGAQTSEFDFKVDEYEENRHFFISHKFRDNYEGALKKLPIVTSNVNITKIEVWVTNKGMADGENRDIVAFMDMGENDNNNIYDHNHIFANTAYQYPDNEANTLYGGLDKNRVRDLSTVNNYLSGASYQFSIGRDYEKIQDAKRLKTVEYSFNSKLGFISLNTSLTPDQVLAVAYRYTVIGTDSVYQVGEFSDEGINSNGALLVKLLRSTAVNTALPMWDLMMKNVYSIGAYQVNSEDFTLNILYSGNENAVPTPYFTDGPASVQGVPLLRLMGFDRLDSQGNPVSGGDGMFDFIDRATTQGGTVNASNGRVFFPVLEPFGSDNLEKILGPGQEELTKKLAFDSLYRSTKTIARQYPEKNKYELQGYYKSSSGSEISLNALNVPQGSVKVMAGGVELSENVDYTVDYTLGRVRIINEGILNSGTPISIRLESQSMFNVQKQTLMGAHVDYKVNRDLNIGATILNLHERPLTQKTNFGDEPISNTIWGMNLDWQTESRFITKMVDALPFVETKAVSNVNVHAEFAHFIPGHSKAVGKSGTSYIDDFEGSKSTIDLKNVGTWFTASTPQGQTQDLFPEAAASTGRAYGFNRAKTSWYVVDPLFYERSSTYKPKNVDNDELSNHFVRQVLESEIFPNVENSSGQILNIPVFNVSFFPSERGPYNYDNGSSSLGAGLNIDGTLAQPESRWGGLMRRIETTDFETSNIEYVEFWLMDPFAEGTPNINKKGGELYFNLGDISEDILRDSRKSFENGLPESENVLRVDTTIWGRVPVERDLTGQFATETAARPYQDVGYDGLSDADEQIFFAEFLNGAKATLSSDAYADLVKDPSGDNYHYFRGSDYDNDPNFKSVLNRYKLYNGVEGNSPADNQSPENYPTLATRAPNREDINQDNTLSESENYFQYKILLDTNKMKVGQNYIVDKRKVQDVQLKNGEKGEVTWYQFKIPVRSPDKIVGNIRDFKSIRFMRMFMRGCVDPMVLRFAKLELVRGEWRTYYDNLFAEGEYVIDDEQSETKFEISSVSFEENGSRYPIPYVLPPGIERELYLGTNTIQRVNEQSMELRVFNLVDGDARAAYKTADFDFRQYNKLKMFVHAEQGLEEQALQEGDLTVFVRLGSDFTENYYEYEIPLVFTPWGTSASNDQAIWPQDNIMEIVLEKLIEAKKERSLLVKNSAGVVSSNRPYRVPDGRNTITVLGRPSLSDVKAIMIGVRNPKDPGAIDPIPKSTIVWVNEFRLTDFNEKSGWAATARVSANLADLGNVTLSGMHSTPGFGGIEQSVSDRSTETVTQLDLATNLELGKFFPEETGLRIPMHFDVSQTSSTPEYNPLEPDIKLNEQLDELSSESEKDSLKQRTIDYTFRKNVNFMNVRKERVGGARKPKVYDVENLDVSYAYSEVFHRNIDIKYDLKKNYSGGIGYTFSTIPNNVKPFKSNKFFSKYKSLALIRDFNFYYAPKMIGFRTDMNRAYNKRVLRSKGSVEVPINPTFIKAWSWNRVYDFKYDLTQSLKLDLRASANAYIDEPPGEINKEAKDYSAKRDSIVNEILDFGSMNQYSQQFTADYRIPIDKLPLLDWTSANARYQSSYRWSASPRSVQAELGNTIENSQVIQLNGNLKMQTLYDKVGFLKKINNRNKRQGSSRRGPGGRRPAKGNDAAADSTAKKPKIDYGRIILDKFFGVVMGFKDGSLTYSQSNGTVLPGFSPQPNMLGNATGSNVWAPGLGFVFGSQQDLRPDAINNEWLVTSEELNSLYVNKFSETFNLRAKVEPVSNLKIELTADRTESWQEQSVLRADEFGQFMDDSGNPNAYSFQRSGNFSMSYNILNTAFKGMNEKTNYSEVFEQFKENRQVIAERLAAENSNFSGNYLRDTLTNQYFPVGYGPTQQDVLIPAFLAAYSGKDVNNFNLNYFPKLPKLNWRVIYDGLSRNKKMKKYFRSFTLSHTYRSSYTISSFSQDVRYREENNDPVKLDDGKNFIPKNKIDVITLSEQFSPLIGVDMTFQNDFMARFEMKQSRNLSLSFVNNQLTELISKEYIFGVGYRFKNVKLNVRSASGKGKKKQLKSDLNIKFDFSIRDNRTVLRRIDENLNQISAGTKVISIKSYAEYQASRRLNIRLFFDRVVNNPHLASQIPNSSTNAGVSLRFTLAN